MNNDSINNDLKFNDGVGDALADASHYEFSWKKTVTVLLVGLIGVILLTFGVLEVGKKLLGVGSTHTHTETTITDESLAVAMADMNDSSWETIPPDRESVVSDTPTTTYTDTAPVYQAQEPQPVVVDSISPANSLPKPSSVTPVHNERVVYRVIAGSFDQPANANNALSALKKLGVDGYVWTLTSPQGRVRYNVQVGAFKTESSARKYVSQLTAKGIDSYIAKQSI